MTAASSPAFMPSIASWKYCPTVLVKISVVMPSGGTSISAKWIMLEALTNRNVVQPDGIVDGPSKVMPTARISTTWGCGTGAAVSACSFAAVS